MRATVVLGLVLLATVLAGCNNPVRLRQPAAVEPVVPLPWADLDGGRTFGAIVAPDWKPGYRFTYEEEGALHESASGDVVDTRQAATEDVEWGPRQGLNYTVANVNASFGQVRFLALQSDSTDQGGAERLLVISPSHLEPLSASVGQWCGYGGYAYGSGFDSTACSNVVQLDEGDVDAAPLDFPLEDGQRRLETDVHVPEPYVPWEPVDVRTRVLGMKEVEGPFGKVQAVHAHQDVVLNLTDVANEDEWGPQDFQVTGHVRAERDLYYAPALLNVVLDQWVSEGRLNGSYVLDGQAHAFERSWRGWSKERLVDVVLKEGPSMSVDELAARIRHQQAADAAYLDVQVQEPLLNVALSESTPIRVSGLPPNPFKVAIDVLDGRSTLVASADSASLDFTPLLPGPYLVAAFAYDERGVLLGRGFALVHAHYLVETSVDCDPFAGDAFGTCPGIEVPLGYPVEFIDATAVMGSPVAGGDQGGRLVLDMGDGQEVSSDRTGSTAQLHVERPVAEPYEVWTLRYKPELAVGQGVQYILEVWPGSLPSQVWDQAFR